MRCGIFFFFLRAPGKNASTTPEACVFCACCVVRFLTVFARQASIPVLLHLWQRLVEYRDPVLHQFLALAWLLTNRRLLLGTSQDDVPEAVSRLRFQSTEIVDTVFGAALRLRKSTPRFFCHVLRRACYEDVGEGGSTTGPGGRGTAVHPRVSLLGDLKATGIVLADADQVAEILLARNFSSTVTSGVQEAADCQENGTHWSAGSAGDRFVLVDCRIPGDATPLAGAAAEANGGAHERKACRTSVVWRRLDPSRCFGRESTAVAELLQEFFGSVGAGAADGACCGSGGADHGLSNGSALSAGTDVVGHCNNGVSFAFSPSSTRKPGEQTATTHVCFIGAGRQGSKAGQSWNSGADAAAAAATEAGVAYRLARAASCSCLTPRVCVLDGGFAALDEALARRRSESLPYSADFAPVPDGADGGAASLSAVSQRQETTGDATPRGFEGDALCKAAVVAVFAGGEGVAPGVKRSGSGLGHGGAAAKATGTSSPSPTSAPSSEAATSPNAAGLRNAAAGAAGNEVSVPRPPTTPRSHSFERKLSRPASSSRISEPFRVYAAKSADEMGRALRGLPVGAGKPLEVT